MPNASGYVALVCRISEDKSGRVEGVKIQEKWGRAYAGRTWPEVPIRVYADNDLSASDDTVRPEFERFREDLAAGLIRHVWAVEQSRLERREAQWFTLAAEFDAAGLAELHTNRDGIVRVRDEIAGIKAVLNAAEVRKLKRRVRDRLDENAAAGIPSGSVPFGYRSGVTATGAKTLIVVEADAEIIRESADRVLAGWSLTNIARNLTGRGVTGPFLVKVTESGRRYTRKREGVDPVVTVDGTPYEDGGTPLTRPGRVTMNSVRSWLTSPTVAGLRVHRGVVTGAGNWAAILDPDTFAAVRNKLAAPRLVTTVTGAEVAVTTITRSSSARKYLLGGQGGVLVCGICGAHLVGTMKQRIKRGRLLATVPYYTCHPKNGGRGCVGLLAEPVEKLVEDELLSALDSPAFRAAVAADEYADDRHQVTVALSALDQRRNELAAEWARGDLTRGEWASAREQLNAQERQLRADLGALPAPVGRIDLAGLREAWPLMTLDEQRELLTMFIDRVAVGRARPGLHTFDSERLSPVDTWWRAAR